MNEIIQFLINAFGECKRVATSLCQNKTSYEITTSSNFFIFDDKDEQPVRIVNKNNYHQLKVKNEKQNEICLIKTDKCLFTNQHKKCDCILFNNSKFFLIEISEAGNRKMKRQKAVLQLGETINKLSGINFDLSTYVTKAIICFKSGETRPTRPSFNSKRAQFLRVYKVSLEEGNEIVF